MTKNNILKILVTLPTIYLTPSHAMMTDDYEALETKAPILRQSHKTSIFANGHDEGQEASIQRNGEGTSSINALDVVKKRESQKQEGEEMEQNKRLSKSAQALQESLRKQGLTDCRVVEFSESTRTALDAAAVIGCDVAQIVKSLVFKTRTHRPVLILASGKNRVNEALITDYIGEPIKKADANFTRNVTGFAIGGVPPLGHKQKIELTFIDKDLLEFETIWAAAGTPNALVELHTNRLAEVTQGQAIPIQ